MTNLAPIFERIAAINPVPDETDLPARATEATALLDVIDERTRTVQTQQTQQTDATPPGGPGQRRTGVFVAVAAFAVVIVVGGVIALTGQQTQDASSATGTTEMIPASELHTRFAPHSMEDAIQPEALLTVERSAYDSDLPERFDIVVYADARVSDVAESPELVTRVIGLPGETVEVRDGSVYVDGQIIDEPYLKNPQIPVAPFDSISGAMTGIVTLGADELWLMGDNRQEAGDSYFRGPIPVSLLRGKVVEIANP